MSDVDGAIAECHVARCLINPRSLSRIADFLDAMNATRSPEYSSGRLMSLTDHVSIHKYRRVETLNGKQARRTAWRCYASTTWQILILVGSLSVSGCAYQIVSSEKIDESRPIGSAEPGGLIYALPMSLVTITGDRDSSSGKVTYTVTPSIVPDPGARYRLRYAPSGNTDDDLNLQVDKNGLLTSTRANFTDRTGDIVIAVAKTVAAFSTPSRATAMRPAVPPAPVYPFSAIYTIDELVRTQVLPDAATISVDANWPVAGSWQTAAVAPSCSFSVCFRTVVPMKGTISGGGTVRNEFVFIAIDPRRTEGITLKSAALVARTNTVTFDSGLITSVAINEPSTTLAIANLPLAVLKAILSAPAELLTLRIANVTDQANLARAQADLLTQMKAVLDAQTALQKAQAGTTPGPSSPITGTGTSPQ